LAKTNALDVAEDGDMRVDLKKGIDLSMEDLMADNTLDQSNKFFASMMRNSGMVSLNTSQQQQTNFADIVKKYSDIARTSNFGNR